MNERTYRLIYGALALALVVTVVLAARFGSPAGDAVELPPPLEAIRPRPGDQVLRQAFLQVDLPVGYELELTIDGFRIPEGEIGFIAGTGVYTWSPGIERSFLEWSAGTHEIEIRWDTMSGLPDPGGYSWSFRVY